MRTRGQIFAERAWSEVPANPSDEFVSRARSFPALVHNCGAAQAVAFVLSKEDKECYLPCLAKVLGTKENGKQLCDRILKAGLPDYLKLTREIMLAAVWIKRTADAKKTQTAGTQTEAAHA